MQEGLKAENVQIIFSACFVRLYKRSTFWLWIFYQYLHRRSTFWLWIFQQYLYKFFTFRLWIFQQYLYRRSTFGLKIFHQYLYRRNTFGLWIRASQTAIVMVCFVLVKRLACTYILIFLPHVQASCMTTTDTDWWAQNCETHSHVFLQKVSNITF